MRTTGEGRIRLLIGLGLCALAPLLVGFLCYPLIPPPQSGAPTPLPNAIFAPTVSASVADTAPGAASNVQAHLSFPDNSTLAIGATFAVPAGWSVASDGSVVNGSVVGSIAGFMTVDDPAPIPPFTSFGCTTTVDFDPLDVPPTDIKLLEATTSTSPTVAGTDTDTNGKPDVIDDTNSNFLPDGVDKYPAFLNTVAPGVHKARYFGHTEAAGITDLYVNILVDELSPGGPYLVTTIVNDPTARPESATNRFCAPQSTTITLLGTSTDNPDTGAVEGGEALYTNPASSGVYTFSAVLVSEFDLDNDGDSNGFDNCPFTANSGQGDADEDYVGDACETDGVQNFDVDSDGLENGYDNCIFIANAGQSDIDFDDIGDACDPNPTTPDGPNYWLSCTDPVGIGVSDPGGATCGAFAATPTPAEGPVGGIAELSEDDGSRLGEAGGSGRSFLVAVVVLISLATGAAAFGAVAWYARKRKTRPSL